MVLLWWLHKWSNSAGRDTLCLFLVPIASDVNLMIRALATMSYRKVITQLCKSTRRELKCRWSLSIWWQYQFYTTRLLFQEKKIHFFMQAFLFSVLCSQTLTRLTGLTSVFFENPFLSNCFLCCAFQKVYIESKKLKLNSFGLFARI